MLTSEFHTTGGHDVEFKAIDAALSPERPIRSTEYLRGRAEELDDIVRELRYFKAIPFVYGHRGVGKTSLARTAAQLVNTSAYEHIYVACAPGGRILQIFREVCEELIKVAMRAGVGKSVHRELELNLSLSPSIRMSFERQLPQVENFEDVNAAVRALKDLDRLLPNASTTVVVLDELEVLDDRDRTSLAYLIKQLGDQEFSLRFVLVGIAENVHELIGAHESVPRYIKEISLRPLLPQDLMDIVSTAAASVSISVPKEVLYRVAIIGNGFPHFAHLVGKALLIEGVLGNCGTVSADIYKKGVARAVRGSLQELRIAYETATQRSQDYFKHLIWALAHSDVVDLRIDQWIDLYEELCDQLRWPRVERAKLRHAISNFAQSSYGKIISNTPARYGEVATRYRYKRFSNMLMRGHVRLQAENDGARLGRTAGL